MNYQLWNTEDDLIFKEYQFSWISWRVRSTKYSTHENVTFCESYAEKCNGEEYWTPQMYIFAQSTKIGTHEN